MRRDYCFAKAWTDFVRGAIGGAYLSHPLNSPRGGAGGPSVVPDGIRDTSFVESLTGPWETAKTHVESKSLDPIAVFNLFQQIGGGSEHVTLEQLKAMLKSKDSTISEAQAGDLYMLFRRDDDGLISLDEFARMLAGTPNFAIAAQLVAPHAATCSHLRSTIYRLLAENAALQQRLSSTASAGPSTGAVPSLGAAALRGREDAPVDPLLDA
jgi:hypothetical protein